MPPAIELAGVTVTSRGHTLLDDVTFSVEEGVFLSVIGPNGAGKTTLLTVINGMARTAGGEVRLFGRAMNARRFSAMRAYIGYVPQRLNIDPRAPLSVYEAVAVGRFGRLGLFRKPGKEDDAAVRSAMEMVGISHLAEKSMGRLSGGENQKVSIARALAQEPRLILFDESTANLDPSSQGEIMRLIESVYREKRCTIVFVTHMLSHIPASCREGVLMKQGRVFYAGTMDEILTEEHLSRLYDCPIEIMCTGGRRHFHAGSEHL